MSNIKKLQEMVQTELLPEVQNFIEKLSAIVETKGTEEDMEVLEETRELEETFETILEDIASGEMDEEEALDLLKELKKMNKKKEPK